MTDERFRGPARTGLEWIYVIAGEEIQYPKQRYMMVDFLRGLAVLLMILFHLAYDLNGFRLIRIDLFHNPFWFCFPRSIVSLFLVCVGMGLSLVHRNAIRWNLVARRFLKIGGWAVVITVVTYLLFPRHFVFFGVLHCIALAGVAGVFFVGRPRISFFIFLAFLTSNVIFRPSLLPVSEWLGVVPMDYIPFYPWFGFVLLGIYLESVNFHKIQFKETRLIALFETLGRHSLKIYLIHRPVLFAMVFGLYKLKTLSATGVG